MNSGLENEYDVVVVGGGIQGASISWMASLAGYKVLLIEKNNWASATSSKSSKLIHGGLRYLQTLQFKLVKECLQERRWMLKEIPYLVKANCFYIPIYEDSHFRPWQIHLGLWLYRLLAGGGEISAYKKIPSTQWAQLPGLNQTGLLAVFSYQDAQTDDTLLTERVVAEAERFGARCLEKTECVSAEKKDQGYTVMLKRDQEEQVHARVIINAAGPWINDVLSQLNANIEPMAIDLVRGTHIVLTPQLSEVCFYLEAPTDQRAIFCLPWQGKTLVGTTEVLHQDSPEKSTSSFEEESYLLDVVRHYFPDYRFSHDGSFSGLRVLPSSHKKVFFRPRDTLIYERENIISLYGGKLTAWRSTAFKLLTVIDGLFGRKSSIDMDSLGFGNAQVK